MSPLPSSFCRAGLLLLLPVSACLSSTASQAGLDAGLALEANALAGASVPQATIAGGGNTSSSPVGEDSNQLSAEETVTLEGQSFSLSHAIWQTVPNSSVISFTISNDPNRCAYLKDNPQSQPETTNVLAFYLAGTDARGGLAAPPGPAVYTYLDPASPRPLSAAYWSTVVWRRPGDPASNLPSSRYATAGQITMYTLDVASRQAMRGALDLSIGPQKDPVSLPFSATFCDITGGS